VSVRRRADGSHAVFPHFLMDRAKPGMITVNEAGRRFVDESTSYHMFALAMQRTDARSVPAFLICDADALRKYGIGMVRPGGKGLEPFLADGYLVQAATLEALAAKLGINASALMDSVARNNRRGGVDTDFGRGVGAYANNIGDAKWTGKNPNLGPLRTAPYYAVRLYPGDIGAATGLRTDEHARVHW
jgi:succinate dehydrogenase/fumarate reductase flavoprotein subunit